MAPKKATRITRWSFSRWSTYETCAFRAKLLYLEGRKESSGPAAKRGVEIHTKAEKYLAGKPKLRLPAELKKFDKFVKALKKETTLQVEQDWAFNEGWLVTSWMDADAWLRMKLDAFYIAPGQRGVVVDWKTGKVYDKHKDQGNLYALAALIRNPELKEVDVIFAYLDSGIKQEWNYQRTEMQELKDYWRRKTKAMLKDRAFVACPSYACRWCSFAKAVGGPCQY